MTDKDEVIVIRSEETTGETAQTSGMERIAGVAAANTGASHIWMGRVIGPPGMDSGPHHHGEAESAIYVVSGHARFCFGEGYSEYEDVGPGDFIFIPARVPHIEQNATDEPVVVIVARSPDNIVVNLDDES